MPSNKRNLTEHQKEVEKAAGISLDWGLANGYQVGAAQSSPQPRGSEALLENADFLEIIQKYAPKETAKIGLQTLSQIVGAINDKLAAATAERTPPQDEDAAFYKWLGSYDEPHPTPKTMAKAAWFAALVDRQPAPPQLTYTIDQLNLLIATCHERGWQEAIEAAANEARRGDNGHDPSERIAAAIRSLRLLERTEEAMNLRDRIETLRDQYAAMQGRQPLASEAFVVLGLVVKEVGEALAATAQSNHNDVVRAATLED
jgi:hypothetical protein